MTTLPEAMAAVTRRFRSHGGTVTVDSVKDGAVRVRFGGLCCGCPSKAVCLEQTVRPQLLAVPGIRSVDAPGARIGAEAEQRLRAFLHDEGAPV